MEFDRWKKIADLFERALILPTGERGQLLQQECGDDPEMRRQVERLLENDSRVGDDFLIPAEQKSKLAGLDFSEAPDGSLALASQSSLPRMADQLVGRHIKSYMIKRLIAEGGMGAVYLAEQENPRREVAMKVMTAGFWSHSAQRRFQFETEILGRLHHPNIAQIYDAGVHRLETGATVLFFAMEFVPGAAVITTYCDEHGLDLSARLRLFRAVCDAVHYGHQKGVVHRDLKPGNLLVDEHGHLRVIDFGVARSTESDIASTATNTQAGQLIGTLAYMSPEQAGSAGTSRPADIDTRSDVYSLGVVLFELLTGQLPYDVSHMTIPSAARVVCDQEPEKPSTAWCRATKEGRHGRAPQPGNRLARDIDTIVLKCLEKSPAKRYTSAAALAEDVERCLRGDVIAARPPTRWTKLVRWVAQHPALVTAALCLLVLSFTTVAMMVTAWHISLRPDVIVRYRDGQPVPMDERDSSADEARLLARNGNELWRWGEAPGSIRFAQLVDRPRCFGGGRSAVIGYGASQDGALANLLCVYDIDFLEYPVWHSKVEKQEILPRLVEQRGIGGDDFSVQVNLVADVFAGDELPGDEVVAVFSTNYSHRIIRIYDLGGELLFEAWHDGSAASIYWMADAGVLVFAGDDHRRNWDDLGRPKSTDLAPLVVFALRPSPGSINRDDYLNSDEALSRRQAGKGSPWLVWYKWLYQEGDKPAWAGEYRLTIGRPMKGNPGRFADIGVAAGDPAMPGRSFDGKYEVNWAIDELGNESPGSRIVGERYKLARKAGRSLPDPDDGLKLSDHLPILSAPPDPHQSLQQP